ncbi:hypothetical protein evm_002007 [Chilo suppressalis]|nr:hypothetical protein evm_002007 [Chilo suppressalis]
MQLLYYVLMLHSMYFSSSNSFDIELEGTIRFGDEFVDKLKTERFGKNIQRDNEILQHVHEFNSRKTDVAVAAQESEYLDNVVNYGVKEITYLSKRLQKEIPIDNNLMTMLNQKVKDYEKKIWDHVIIAKNYKTKTNTDRENIYLDVAAFSNTILHSDEKSMFYMVLENIKENITEEDIGKFNELIYKARIDHMKQVLDFLCAKLNVCRTYPGFSEYIADLISDLLKMSDGKLRYLMNFVKEKVVERATFFKAFMKQDVIDMLALKLGYLTQDLYNVRELLAVVRSIITSRYKMMKSHDKDLKLQTTAARMLLDIIDKAFSKQRDDMTVITFDTTVKALRNWQTGDRDDVKMPIQLLLEHIVKVLRENWNLATRQDVMILTEVMTFGESNDEGFQELLSKGSDFLHEEYISPLL